MHHYAEADTFGASLATVRHRDAMKLKLAQEKGITIIVIPCWWDAQLER